MSISAKEAKRLVVENSRALRSEQVALDSGALGRALAAALRAPQPSPRWDVSAMDGFAVRSADFPRAYAADLEILGTAKAGEAPKRLGIAGAIRIMTGAMIPWGADAVVPKELAQVEGRMLFVGKAAAVAKGDHIRWAGEELKKGSIVAKAGTRLNSRWIGFLHGLGISEAQVASRPRVALLITGTELRSAGLFLEPGKIHDSNGPMLEAALAESGLHARAVRVADDPLAFTHALRAALSKSELLLVSGGVSVGEADFSRPAFKKLGVKEIFWGVAQKPGKPLYFGVKGNCLVFGLPGNPAAAWVCYHEYVLPAIHAMQGFNDEAPTRFAMAESEPRRDAQKTLFLKASLQGPNVRIMGGQQSHMLKSLAEANALARVEPKGRGRLLEVSPL